MSYDDKMEAAGIEPASVGDATYSTTSSCENQPEPRAALALQPSDSDCLNLTSIDSDLREVVLAWSDIAVQVRQAILFLARNGGSK